MLTEAMRRAGWREWKDLPPLATMRHQMEHQGIEWTVKTPEGQVLTWDTCSLSFPVSDLIRWPWRPVSTQTWDYDPRGWSVVVPTEAGLWWRDDYDFPVQVVTSLMFDGTMIFMQIDEAGEWMDAGTVEDDGHWIAPCIKPEVSNESQD